MTSRRSFLGTMAGGLAATSALGRVVRAAGADKPPLGLQLWSVRRQLQKDLPGTLKLVKSWGIDEVETAGLYDRTPQQFAAELKNAGLRCHSMHVGFERLEKELPAVLKEADALGATTVINPSLPHRGRGPASREEILAAASAFSKWAEACKAGGKRFGYHTHSAEFGPAPEGTLFDVLAKEAGPDLGFELDVFWVVWGGGDVRKIMDEYRGRIWYTHLKDMTKGVVPGKSGQDMEKANAVLGEGQMDVKGIVAAGRKAGVEINFIEDESADPIAHIPLSARYYNSL